MLDKISYTLDKTAVAQLASLLLEEYTSFEGMHNTLNSMSVKEHILRKWSRIES